VPDSSVAALPFERLDDIHRPSSGGFGKNNPPVISALFGHGTNKGGIANGVAGKKGDGDGSGIDWKTADGGNEWRWIEQWIPHSGWFLVAASAMAQAPVVQAHPSSRSRH